MRLILMGPPGAGKGTQTSRIVARYAIPAIGTGDLLRTAIAEGTDVGRAAKAYIDRGALVPDSVVVPLALDRITWPDAAGGFLLDGFPRTREQAEALDSAVHSAGQRLNAVVLLEAPDDLLVERIAGRRIDPQTGTVYHLKFRPPPPEAAPRLVQRSDDSEEVVRARLQAYRASTAPVAVHYEAKGLLRRLDGVGSADEVSARVFSELDASV